jgi:hypothetical protein
MKRPIFLAAVLLVASVLLPVPPSEAQIGRSITVTPDTGLVDRDVVTLAGTGYSPNATIFYCQGVDSGGPPDPANCGTPFQSTLADASGEFTTAFTVTRFIYNAAGTVTDCAQPMSACAIGAVDFFAPGGAIALAPISFEPQDPADADPFRVVGTIDGPDGTPLEGAQVWGYLTSDGWVGSQRTTTGQDGTFALEDVLPGVAYRILIRAPGFVAEWFGDAPSRSQAVNVRVTHDMPVGQVDAALVLGGSIAGVVVDAAGMPVPGTSVGVYGVFNTWAPTYIAATGADGTYRVDNVWPDPDGWRWQVRFDPPSESGLAREWFDDVAKRSQASTVGAVEPGSVVEVDAQLEAVP